MIERVEKGAAPDTLNRTAELDPICRWPLRPLWSNNGTSFECVYDQPSINTWKYNFDAWKLPLY